MFKALKIIGATLLIGAVASPFVVNAWITVSERNHALQRKLDAERAAQAAQRAKADRVFGWQGKTGLSGDSAKS